MDTEAEYLCLICNSPMFGIHCKLVCPNCGYREDCGDLFPHRPPEPPRAPEPSPTDPPGGQDE